MRRGHGGTAGGSTREVGECWSRGSVIGREKFPSPIVEHPQRQPDIYIYKEEVAH